MTQSIALTDDERNLLVSVHISTQLTIRQLAEHFKTTPGAIKRCQRQIRDCKQDVYLIPPRRGRKKIGYRYCAKGPSGAPEAQENPLGILDPVVACGNHLVDLERWHAPLSSRSNRVTPFSSLRARA